MEVVENAIFYCIPKVLLFLTCLFCGILPSVAIGLRDGRFLGSWMVRVEHRILQNTSIVPSRAMVLRKIWLANTMAKRLPLG